MKQKNNALDKCKQLDRVKDRDILLCEYTQLNGLYKQRDTVIWTMGTIFVGAVLVIIGYAMRYSGEYGDIRLLPFAISSMSILILWRLMLERMRYFSKMNEERMKCIEGVLGMNSHCLFDEVEKKNRFRQNFFKDYGIGSQLGIRRLADWFIVFLSVFWVYLTQERLIFVSLAYLPLLGRWKAGCKEEWFVLMDVILVLLLVAIMWQLDQTF